MVSKTKYHLDNDTVVKIFEKAGLPPATGIQPLGTGEFNAVYSVTAGGKDYALKVAPKEGGGGTMTYEKDMIESEVFWYKKMKDFTPILVPEIHFVDFSKTLIPVKYFIMDKIRGEQLDKIVLTDEEKSQTKAEMAKLAAYIHSIEGAKFGYIQNGLHDNWYLAIKAMVSAILCDAEKKGKHTKRGDKLLFYIDHYKDILEKAPCSMVNFDLWAPNIICSRTDGKLYYYWIDPERSFWGDPISDFVCLEMMTPLPNKKESLAAYNSVAKKGISASYEENIRYAVMQGYLGAIMEVEKYYRYTPRHFGWWRNVFASAMLFKNSFSVLKRK